MKRVLTFLAIMLLPLSVMAMTPISDNDMSKVTGQAGVSMTFDLTLNMSFGQLGWGDSDGAPINFAAFGATSTNIAGGWVGIDNLRMSTLHIWPRTDYTMEAVQTGTGDWDDLKWLTIDVVTLGNGMGGAVASQLFSGTAADDVTAVRIGVPTLTLTMEEMTGNVVLGHRTPGSTVGGVVNGYYYDGTDTEQPTFDQLLGKFYVGGMNMATGGGEILIFAHGHNTGSNAMGQALYGSGVSIALTDVTISYLLVDEAAWGDVDGAYDVSEIDPAYNTGTGLAGAAWVGITGLAIENVVVNGLITIDVGTYTATGDTVADNTTGGALNFLELVQCFDDAFQWKQTQGGAGNFIGDSFIFIGLKDVTVTMDKMYGVAALATDNAGRPNFDGTQVLGDIYVGGMSMAIAPNPVTGTNSWFAIFAH